MPNTCIQEPVIDGINKTLERMERTQEKLVSMLEKVADQGARLHSLETQLEAVENNLFTLSERARSLELEQTRSLPEVKLVVQEAITGLSHSVDQILNKTSLMTSKPVYIAFIVTGVLTLIGTLCDVMYHVDTFKLLMGFIRG